jgi:hypothetical protein
MLFGILPWVCVKTNVLQLYPLVRWVAAHLNLLKRWLFFSFSLSFYCFSIAF